MATRSTQPRPLTTIDTASCWLSIRRVSCEPPHVARGLACHSGVNRCACAGSPSQDPKASNHKGWYSRGGGGYATVRFTAKEDHRLYIDTKSTTTIFRTKNKQRTPHGQMWADADGMQSQSHATPRHPDMDSCSTA
eukprot:scaffold10537_cov122-Isochrysis_galbana.AAC.19